MGESRMTDLLRSLRMFAVWRVSMVIERGSMFGLSVDETMAGSEQVLSTFSAGLATDGQQCG